MRIKLTEWICLTARCKTDEEVRIISLCLMAALSLSRQREEGIKLMSFAIALALALFMMQPNGLGGRGYHLKPILESPGPYTSLDLFCFPSDGHEREKMFLAHHAHKASGSVGLLP